MYDENTYEKKGPQALYSEKLESERKKFYLDLRENDRGRFIKITEDVKGRRDTIMLPAELLSDFCDALEKIEDYIADNPSS